MGRKVGQPGAGCQLSYAKRKVIKDLVIGKAVLLLAALLILFQRLAMTFFFILLQIVLNIPQFNTNVLFAGKLPQ